MNVKIINGNILVHENEIYTKRKIIKSETGHFDLSEKEKEKFARIRKTIDDNHPMKNFKSMLEEKMNDLG